MNVKKFDCVQMKHDIQQKIIQEMDGLSTEEKRHHTEKIILSEPLLEHIWNNVRRFHIVHSRKS